MGFLDRFFAFLETYSNNFENSYEEEKERMRYKSDSQLKEIATSCGTSATASGRRKAALEELRRRGYN